MKVLALDRDGVVNFDSENYILNHRQWRPIPGSLEAIVKAKKFGFTVAIISNQSALGRKMIDVDSFHKVNKKFLTELNKLDCFVDLFLVCPHTPEQDCNCRKPKSGLFFILRDLLEINLTDLIFIGDRLTDAEAAQKIGAKPILVETGKPIEESKMNILKFKNLKTAVDFIIENDDNF